MARPSRFCRERPEHELARDRELVAHGRNTARFFAENRQVAWVALIASIVWGVFGYILIPKAKDPTIEVRVAVVTCVWPGARAEDVEQLVTHKVEQKLAEASSVEKIESISRTGVSIVYVTVKDGTNRPTEWNNLQARLDAIRDLPPGAGPIRFLRDYGDTATLMLTVASPKVSDIEIELRARSLERTITRARAAVAIKSPRATIIISVSTSRTAVPLSVLSARRIARSYLDDAAFGHRAATRGCSKMPGFVAPRPRARTLDDRAALARAVRRLRRSGASRCSRSSIPMSGSRRS